MGHHAVELLTMAKAFNYVKSPIVPGNRGGKKIVREVLCKADVLVTP